MLPLAAGHGTLRDLRGTLITLLAVPPLLGAGGNPARALRRPPVERCGVTGTDPWASSLSRPAGSTRRLQAGKLPWPQGTPAHTHRGEHALQDSNARGRLHLHRSPPLPRSTQRLLLFHVFKGPNMNISSSLNECLSSVQAFKLFDIEADAPC